MRIGLVAKHFANKQAGMELWAVGLLRLHRGFPREDRFSLDMARSRAVRILLEA